jgi:hypothetical protein
MLAREYWRVVTVDRSDLLDRLLERMREYRIRFCVVGGQAVNAYAEPVVSLDLDIVVAVDDLPSLQRALGTGFRLERFPHSLNISAEGSDLRVQVQTDPRYADFIERAQTRAVLGIELPVARIEDVLQGKTWAVVDPEHRASKRQKDLADIARLIEVEPRLRVQVPREVLERLI